ncbi:methylosome subunit pICln [Aethina tumida]|uniref:methylosome subunit pICln n=1 Tax=Aethina tumida TaxID=116153 RepID=UPI00096B1E3C|nr:methylosome subunit pICln [Aethina tumida]
MVIINSFSHPDAPVRLQQNNVRAVLDKKDLGLGTLYICDSILGWQATDNVGFTMNFEDVSLHAISRDRNLHPRDAIYIIVDSHFCLAGQEDRSVNDEEDSEEDSEADISELILEPQNPLTLPSLYETLKICQELNPDPIDLDEEDEDDLYVDAEMEGDYIVTNADRGDAEVRELSRRLQSSSVDIQYVGNGHDLEEEYEDAD